MGDILVDADYADVRDLVGADVAILPDTVLNRFTFLDTVEALVKLAIEDWSAIIDAGSGNDYVFLRSGTVYLLALRVAMRFRQSIQFGHGFSFGGYSESAKAIDWDAVIDTLKEWAEEAFGNISTRVWTRPVLILMDGPTSSGANVPSDFEVWIDRILPRVLDWEEESGEDDAEW